MANFVNRQHSPLLVLAGSSTLGPYGDAALQWPLWAYSPGPSAPLPPTPSQSSSDRSDPSHAFQGLSPIAIAQAAISILVLLLALSRPLLRRKPQWCSPFAQEDAPSPRSRQLTHWTACLMFISCLGFGLTLFSILSPPWGKAAFIDLSPWAVALLLVVKDQPTTTPIALLVIYITILGRSIASLALLYIYESKEAFSSSTVWNTCLGLTAIAAILSMPFRDPRLDHSLIGRSVPSSELRSPEDNLTLWKFMTVSWMSPLISRGYTQRLDDGDVWLLPYEFQHGRLHVLFRDLPGSILRRLILANGLDLIIITILSVVESAANLAAPFLLMQLLRSIQIGHDNRAASIYAFSILIVRLIAAQSSVFTLWFSRRCYERSRGEMITTIYAKTLTRKSFGQYVTEKAAGSDAKPPSTWARLLACCKSRRKDSQNKSQADETWQPASTGKILNLMRNDAYEVAQRFWDFPIIVTKPLVFVFSLVLVWKLIGWPCLFGLACVLFAQILNVAIIRQLLKVERVRRTATDVRLQATSQFVEGIRHLRWYDWQSKWLEGISRARQQELGLRVKSGLWKIAMTTLSISTSTLFPVATFFAHTFIAGRELPVELVFPALELFSLLETSFKALPNLVTIFLNASISMRRIEEFMSEPDREETESRHKILQVDFRGASFAWPGQGRAVLDSLDLSFPVGLTLVFGKVGCGKSALLQAILGELDTLSGEATLPAEMVGYCAQSPWLQHMSIRENILFSAPYDPTRYKEVLHACELLPDLASFKHGDLSDIGENGVGLSGGQKARVALARAVYSNSRILLLDDPLAALDHQTADSIVQKLVGGPLFQGRIVILVTHRTDLCLHLADQIVEIDSGKARVLDAAEASREVERLGIQQNSKAAAANDAEAPFNESQHDEAILDKFIEDEHRATGGVVASVYLAYIKAGKLKWWTILIVVFGLFRLCVLLNYWFLKAWSEGYGDGVRAFEFDISHPFGELPSPVENISPWLLTYLAIALLQTGIYTLSEGIMLVMVYKAAKELFTRVIERVSRATFRFYDTTPVGRLMNRLLSDMGMIDGGIMYPLQQVAWWTLMWLSSIVVIASVTPVFLVFSISMTVWFVYIFLRFLPTSQSLRRLEMASLSPLMSNFGILLDGLATIRAFKVGSRFQDRNIAVVDAFQKMDHFYWSLQAWLMYRFDALSAFATFSLTLLALYKGFTPGLTAFILTTATQFVEATHALCKQYGTLQMDFVSVERVVELLDIPEEPSGKLQPPPSWPSITDSISFDAVTLKYAPELKPSLSDASFSIPGGSTCAVLGRTGSGKSTLALALLATIRPEKGSIRIGDIDLADVDVHTWRQRISFVAQDPVLFPGTLRENLDPLVQHTDEECLTVLRTVLGPEWTLDAHVERGGRNLSQGQRQLVGIGRAVLRKSPVVVLDEATASIDKETAARMHDVLREQLGTSTVITIAHRLEAVKDADYFLRLDSGRVVESGLVTHLLD